jgi:LAGLIDADG endonuclease
LHPKYVTGISDAESTFSFTIIKRITNKTGWFIQPIFQIELHNKDALILEKLQSFFGVGNFRIKNIKGKNSVAIFSVVSIKDLINIIIPHFYKYPLLTQKRADFELFKQIVLMMDKKDHLTMEGIKKIISIRASLNKGLSPLLINHFPKLVPCERPQVETPETFDPF